MRAISLISDCPNKAISVRPFCGAGGRYLYLLIKRLHWLALCEPEAPQWNPAADSAGIWRLQQMLCQCFQLIVYLPWQNQGYKKQASGQERWEASRQARPPAIQHSPGRKGSLLGIFAIPELQHLRSGSMVFIFRAIKTECKSRAPGLIQSPSLKVFVLLSKELECQIGFVKWQSN